MLHALVSRASRFFNDLGRSLFRESLPAFEPDEAPASKRTYQRLERVVLTDSVARTLFEEYASHRQGASGDNETGWVLLGIREETEAVVLATLPAGAQGSAGVAHVHFNSRAQALASRIVRQWDKRLAIVGVVHTHPGSLRHPSDGDYRGDSLWVGQLRGREGIFAIGTADGTRQAGPPIARQPQPHVQSLGELLFHWYALADSDGRYRPLPVQLTLGPDLALPLHSVWSMIETHAEALERLAVQQASVSFAVLRNADKPALSVECKLAAPFQCLRLLLHDQGVGYYLVRDDDLIEVDPKEKSLDRAVYLILAELTGREF